MHVKHSLQVESPVIDAAPGRTRGPFTIGELTGNRSALQKIARDALDKLDDFEEVEEPA